MVGIITSTNGTRGRVCWKLFLVQICCCFSAQANVGLLLVLRLRCWPDIKPTLVIVSCKNDHCFTSLPAGPMIHSYRLGHVTWRYQVRILVGPDICHRGCAHTVFQTVQRPGVYGAAYGTVHYKEPLKSFKIRVGHSPGFGLPSVAILPWLYRKRRKTIFIHSFCFRRFLHHLRNVATKGLCSTRIECRLQGSLIVHSTSSTAHPRPLNSLKHCICTTSMTNIRPSHIWNEFRAETWLNVSTGLASAAKKYNKNRSWVSVPVASIYALMLISITNRICGCDILYWS